MKESPATPVQVAVASVPLTIQSTSRKVVKRAGDKAVSPLLLEVQVPADK
jgi:hypothetical protein